MLNGHNYYSCGTIGVEWHVTGSFGSLGSDSAVRVFCIHTARNKSLERTARIVQRRALERSADRSQRQHHIVKVTSVSNSAHGRGRWCVRLFTGARFITKKNKPQASSPVGVECSGTTGTLRPYHQCRRHSSASTI